MPDLLMNPKFWLSVLAILALVSFVDAMLSAPLTEDME